MPLIAREAWAERPGGSPRRLPLVRADCAGGERPCPFVTCRYHLWLDVTKRGNVVFNFPDLEPGDLEPSCALDVLEERGALTLEETARALNLTRERVRQIEEMVRRRLAEGLSHWRGEGGVATVAARPETVRDAEEEM